MQVSPDFINKTTETLLKVCSDMNVMVRDTMNASLQSTTILTKGCGELFDSVNTLVQKSLENNAQAIRDIMNAKNPQDVMDANTILLKSGYDNIMLEMNRVSQLSSRLAQQAAEPVTNNMNATIIKFSQNKAA